MIASLQTVRYHELKRVQGMWQHQAFVAVDAVSGRF